MANIPPMYFDILYNGGKERNLGGQEMRKFRSLGKVVLHCQCGYKFEKGLTNRQAYDSYTGQQELTVVCPQCGRKLNEGSRH